ncbi:hypothetical protein O181_000802 [Austropuccinia psidii MF-1]|uniref:Uncharacterized protein n=1 Tax=Austropuccinia psidii MF-1 TaxID=1389203 RepID=A0A9Q3B9K9_9BASI|nr:hypothetical protein [Austropuccinia psidii MF-1]
MHLYGHTRLSNRPRLHAREDQRANALDQTQTPPKLAPDHRTFTQDQPAACFDRILLFDTSTPSKSSPVIEIKQTR